MGAITVGYRGGGHDMPSAEELGDAIDGLVRGLVTEEWDPPDDEHVQGYLRREADGCALTGYVDGLLRFDPDLIDWKPQPPLYSKVETVAELREAFRRFAAGALPVGPEHGWVSSARDLELPGREFRRYPAS